MKRTLERELKVPEIVGREANGICCVGEVVCALLRVAASFEEASLAIDAQWFSPEAPLPAEFRQNARGDDNLSKV